MSITKAALEDKIRAKVSEYTRAKEEGSYLRGSASEGAIKELLYKYATGIFKRSDEAQADEADAPVPDLSYMEKHYGLEILEAARDALQYYSEDKGDFIHFFNFLLKQRINMAYGKEITDQMSGGMAIPQRKAIILSKARRRLESADAAEERGKPEIDSENMKQLIDSMYEDGEISETVSLEEVTTYLSMRTTTLTYETEEEGVGEYKRSVLEVIGSDSVERSAEIRDELRMVLLVIGREFERTQNRQKGYLREMLTVLFVQECESARVLKEMISKSAPWFDWKICGEYMETRRCPTRAQMSARYGVYEESLARALTKFLAKVESALR